MLGIATKGVIRDRSCFVSATVSLNAGVAAYRDSGVVSIAIGRLHQINLKLMGPLERDVEKAESGCVLHARKLLNINGSAQRSRAVFQASVEVLLQ